MAWFTVKGHKNLEDVWWRSHHVLVCYCHTLGFNQDNHPQLIIMQDVPDMKTDWLGKAVFMRPEVWIPNWKLATIGVTHTYPGRLYGTRHIGVVMDRSEKEWEAAFRYLARRECNPILKNWSGLPRSEETSTSIYTVVTCLKQATHFTAEPFDWRTRL